MTPEQLRTARGLLNLTQAELGDEIGISGKHISDLERGEGLVTRQTALAVECVLRRERLFKRYQEQTSAAA